jgi:hypothetical protein
VQVVFESRTLKPTLAFPKPRHPSFAPFPADRSFASAVVCGVKKARVRGLMLSLINTIMSIYLLDIGRTPAYVSGDLGVIPRHAVTQRNVTFPGETLDMTRIKTFVALLTAMIFAFAMPSLHAQNLHVVGASATSQFLTAAIAADQLALNEIAANVANGTWSAGEVATFHWTAKNSANIIDNRSSLIQPQVGNIFIVWIAQSSDPTGNTGVTDIWTAESVDSTVAVRSFSAQQTGGSGSQLQIIPAAAGNLVSPTSLWPDGNPDVTLVGVTNVYNTIGTSSSGAGDAYINVALTDLRPEDALYATTRALTKLNTTTWAGLGYIGANASIGEPIYTAQGTGTQATPVKFALSGQEDPITKIKVPAYTTIPVGACPVIFVLNNGGTFSSSTANLVTGVGTKGPFPLAHLFDGSTTADTHNAAFGGAGDGAGTPLTLFLREPISGTMNVAEFTEFRSSGNTDDSQEVGVINPYDSPYNPLNLATPTHGVRQRALSTSEVVGNNKSGSVYGLLGTPNSLGYIFFSFANASKLSGSSFNYLTLDGVDPLSIPGTVNQELPNGTVTSAAAVWTSGPSFPNLRNGTYKSWSFLRYLVPNSLIGSDAYGPDVLAYTAQDSVNNTSADYVPFEAQNCTGGTAPNNDGIACQTNAQCTAGSGGVAGTCTITDGLDVYRSHFKQSNVAGNNGSATTANPENGGNTLGGATEAGGDVGGAIEGPFGITVADTTGTVTTSGTNTKNKGYKVTWKTGAKFTAGTTWEGGSITIDGASYTIADVAVTATTLYVTTDPGDNTTAVSYSAAFPYTYPLATAPGVLNAKQ